MQVRFDGIHDIIVFNISTTCVLLKYNNYKQPQFHNLILTCHTVTIQRNLRAWDSHMHSYIAQF